MTTVGDLLISDVVTVRPEESLRTAARRMVEAEIGTLIVVDPLARPLGILTDRDVMARCVAAGRNPRRTRVGRVMSAPVVWVRAGVPIEQTIDRMARLHVRRLPVVDARDRLIGIVALDDALADRLGDESDCGRALRATM